MARKRPEFRPLRVLDGWERYSSQALVGIYSDQQARLFRKATDHVSFFLHVAESSSLPCDRAFAALASKILSQFANQSASERMNKYVGDIHCSKRYQLSLSKGDKMLQVKMHLMHKELAEKTHRHEQKRGVDIPTDRPASRIRRGAHIGRRGGRGPAPTRPRVAAARAGGG
uniref:Uncharacterized protein n=1 Tax=Coccolithus braarudii TaxID=221442 RepID=A0A7S0LJ61_9EUKA|mmetsp:Transcript_43432/g.92438  ORF Transcript_43432/g.92438 Transcript_43432/m.92438 type:complete len:171 (+) Transcript_43432:178-690(+)